jgi:hypothetical protein
LIGVDRSGAVSQLNTSVGTLATREALVGTGVQRIGMR